jgi:hypothetical protein
MYTGTLIDDLYDLSELVIDRNRVKRSDRGDSRSAAADSRSPKAEEVHPEPKREC